MAPKEVGATGDLCGPQAGWSGAPPSSSHAGETMALAGPWRRAAAAAGGGGIAWRGGHGAAQRGGRASSSAGPLLEPVREVRQRHERGSAGARGRGSTASSLAAARAGFGSVKLNGGAARGAAPTMSRRPPPRPCTAPSAPSSRRQERGIGYGGGSAGRRERLGAGARGGR
ncbi:dehydrin Rab16B-like [Panicum virgatum]|uniref:dehydrin Rab16B-like n=1 Tax=Panicum virgatum TaxID=38727 RepID=UPI0019D5E9E3|nr:dehydrin Rab16B-like [Panicum virgatum]